MIEGGSMPRLAPSDETLSSAKQSHSSNRPDAARLSWTGSDGSNRRVEVKLATGFG